VPIDYTNNLKLPLIPDGYGEEPEENWGPEMRDAMETLDKNPGVTVVNSEQEMLDLDVWDGRIVRRADVGQYWHFNGDPDNDGEWEELELGTAETGVTGGAMRSTETETTSTASPGSQVTGDIDYEFFPGTGEEIMLLQFTVKPWADFVDVTDEEVTLDEEDWSRLNQRMARHVKVEDIVVMEDTEEDPTEYEEGVDYEVGLDDDYYTRIRRIDGGAIADGETVLVSYSYQPGVENFRLRLRSKETGGDILYELDTRKDPEWPRGHAVKDPNFGYLPICYFRNDEEEPKMWYEITNFDESLESAFIIDCKYKPLT